MADTAVIEAPAAPAAPAAPTAPVVGLRAYSKEAARERLGISMGALDTLLRSGRIRGIKIGRRKIIPEAELARFLSEASESGRGA